MNIDIDKLTEPELIDLNRRIVERLRMIRQLKAHATMLKYSVGEKVYFLDNYGEEVVGTLTKYNKKTVTVITQDGRQWNVTPSLLNKIEDDTPSVQPDNIIELQPKRQQHR